jgi:hypothetical protein
VRRALRVEERGDDVRFDLPRVVMTAKRIT